MRSAGSPSAARDDIAAILRGERTTWTGSEAARAQLMEDVTREEVAGLLHERISRTDARGWPAALLDHLRDAASARAAEEVVCRREIIAALNALCDAGVRPLIFKGTALAYSIYREPMMRPRADTDILVRRTDVDAARIALSARGWTPRLLCDGELVFRQFAVSKTDAFGLEHEMDVHWKVSTHSLFGEVVTFDEMDAEAVPLPNLGPHARGAGPVHALLLACVHPSMHHRRLERLLWVHDVHLLASGMSAPDLDRFATLAIAKQVAAIVLHELTRARTRFGTAVPDRIVDRLASVRAEPSSSYLRDGRGWRHDLASNIGALRTSGDRRRLLREVLLPDRRYMLARYGIPEGPVGTALLPLLHVHRCVWGAWKVAAGRK